MTVTFRTEVGAIAAPLRYTPGMRWFNTTGPCNAELHYMIPPEPRLPGCVALVDKRAYFVVHACGTTRPRAAVGRCAWARRARSTSRKSYLARLGLDEGVLVLFDCRAAAAPIEERTRFEEAQTPSGRHVTVLRG